MDFLFLIQQLKNRLYTSIPTRTEFDGNCQALIRSRIVEPDKTIIHWYTKSRSGNGNAGLRKDRQNSRCRELVVAKGAALVLEVKGHKAEARCS